MARIALKIWSAIISAFAVMAAHAPADASVSESSTELGAITVERSRKPDLFLQKSVTTTDQNIMLARGGGGRGHSSHSSHASHASHYSGSTGTGTTSAPSDSKLIDTAPSTSADKKAEKSISMPSSGSMSGVSSKGSKSSPIAASGEAASRIEVNKVFLKGGGVLGCDYVWRDGKSVKVMVSGSVLTIDSSDIDEEKTFGK